MAELSGQQPPNRSNATAQRGSLGEPMTGNALYKSNRTDDKIRVPTDKAAQNLAKRPSIMSSRRPIRMDSGAANFMAEMDLANEVDVVVEHETNDMQQFDKLAEQMRGGPPATKKTTLPEVTEIDNEFEVVASPAVVK